MSRKCDICGRGPQSSVSVSHSKIATKRVLNINLHTKKIDQKTVKMCSVCLRTRNKASK